MNEVVLSQSCSELNNADSKDCIYFNKIIEQELKNSSQFYVESFKAFAIKTAQSTLEMCRVVAEAKQHLTKDRFQTFCTEIGHRKEDATIRKYIVIGNHYEQFINYAEFLPNSWTSIYKITQLPTDVFDALVLTGNSMANMTGEQIKQLMAPKKSDQHQTNAKSDQSDMQNVVANEESVKTEPAAADAAEPPKDSISRSDAPTMSSDQSSIAGAPTSHSASSDDVTDNSQTNNSTPSDLQPSSDSSPSDLHYAKQATSKVLETAKTSSKNSVGAEDEFEPYSVTFHFKKKPTVEDIKILQELIFSFNKKYCIEVNTKTNIAVVS